MFNLMRSQRATLTPTAGVRSYVRLLNAVQTYWLDVLLTATLTIATADAAAILNQGSLLAAFSEMGIEENGRDRWQADPRALGFYAETSAPSAITRSRLTSVAQGATSLVETVRLYFAHPYAVNPRETAYLEQDPRQLLQFFIKLDEAGAAKIATAGGGGTVTLSDVSVKVVQAYNKSDTKRPYFIPTVRQTTINVDSDSTSHEAYIKASKYLRAILIQAESSAGVQDDVISALALRGDLRDIIGPEMMDWDQAVRSAEYDFGGAVGAGASASKKAYLLLNFQQNGRLNEVLNPAQDVNLRFIFDAAPSASGNNTKIRITLFELEHDPAATDVNGQPLVTPLAFAV